MSSTVDCLSLDLPVLASTKRPRSLSTNKSVGQDENEIEKAVELRWPLAACGTALISFPPNDYASTSCAREERIATIRVCTILSD